MSWRSALAKNLQELRVHLCQTSGGSKGAREFVFSSYAELKKANPRFPILIRECGGVEARLIARYDYGVEKSVSIEGKASTEITSELQKLIKMGETMPRSTESNGSLFQAAAP
eukprot:evm.model.scf_1770.3 EVM.evm.TU.scf_1770.3   scf_1770:11934-14694(+)